MANHILKDILPEEKIIKVDLHEGSFSDLKFFIAFKFLVYLDYIEVDYRTLRLLI
jgi:hypothetical protein